MAVDFVVCAWLCCYSDNDDEDSVQIEIDSTDSIARGAANGESDAQGATNTDSEARGAADTEAEAQGATNTDCQARGATNTESEEQTMTLALAEARRYLGPGTHNFGVVSWLYWLPDMFVVALGIKILIGHVSLLRSQP